jgi:hypothetical protein
VAQGELARLDARPRPTRRTAVVVAGSLEGPLAKWARADAKLQRLRLEVNAAWPPHQLWPVRTEADRTGLKFRFYMGELPDIQPDWALEAGEILFNLRSALDHLAYELAVRRFRGRIPGKIEGTTQFPIYDAASAWKQGHWRIQHLAIRDRRALKQFQPFITRTDRWEWHRFWLSRLNAWHNVDKHRRLHLVTGAKNSSVIMEPRPRSFVGADFIYGPMRSHSHVETWTFSEPPQEMTPHPGVFLHVALEHGGEYDRLCDVALYATAARVREVLDRFADRF